MSLIIKAHLYRNWLTEPIETRRFSIDQDVATNYTYLTEKLARVFPQFEAQDVIISYIDTDGDRVTVSSDEELTDAFDQFDGSIFRIHIKQRNEEPFVPPFFQQQFIPFVCPYKNWYRQQQQPAAKDDSPKPSDTPIEKEPEKKDGTAQPNTDVNEPRPKRPCGGGRSWDCGPWQQQQPPCGGYGNFGQLGPLGNLLQMWANAAASMYNVPPTTQNTDPKDDDKMDTDQKSTDYSEVLEQLKQMGFEDEGGWLNELVKAKEGNLQKVLDALHPSADDSSATK